MTAADELLAVVALLLPAAAPETTRLAKTIAVTATATVTTTVTANTTATVVTPATALAAQTLGKASPHVIACEADWRLTCISDRDVKEEREDRDRRDNGANGEDRKGMPFLSTYIKKHTLTMPQLLKALLPSMMTWTLQSDKYIGISESGI